MFQNIRSIRDINKNVTKLELEEQKEGNHKISLLQQTSRIDASLSSHFVSRMNLVKSMTLTSAEEIGYRFFLIVIAASAGCSIILNLNGPVRMLIS